MCVLVDLKVNGLQIVICLEYLMKIKDFFVDGMPTSAAPATPATPSQPAGYF